MNRVPRPSQPHSLTQHSYWKVATWLLFALAPFTAVAQTPSAPAIRAAAPPATSTLAEAESLSQAFNAAAKHVLPSVVKIRTVTSHRVMIRGLFPIQAPDQEGLGSGVIIRSDGIILTNNHVVKDANTVIVELQDGTELYATEYQTDPLTDLAIVKVKTNERLPASQLGDSDRLSIGDWVLAVGHPLELETSVSAGIISAKGRSLGRIPRAQFLQTDAAINPGNSGGPLVNLRGEVVGINTAIASQTGGYQGIGFAIPANYARDVVTQLLEKGSVTRGYLGVSIQEVTKDMSQLLIGRSGSKGVLVNHVRRGTPAEQAGIRPGDVITSFANFPVASPAALQRAVERVPIGSQQRMEIVRFGKTMSVSVSTLRFEQEQIGEQFQGQSRRLSIPVGDNSSLGFKVDSLAKLARQQGYRVEGDAVLITQVSRNSLAANANLRPGMIIKQVRDTKVSNVEQFYAALRNESLAEGILLLVEDTQDDTASDRFVIIRAIQ